MIRLIGSEFKKIFKSKFNIVLWLLFVSYTGGLAASVYHDGINDITLGYESEPEWVFQDEHGNDIENGLPYVRFADKLQHQYQGTLDEALVHQQAQDLRNINTKFPRKTLDKEAMIRSYGNNYETFLEEASQGKYSMNELNEHLMSTQQTIYSWESDGGDDQPASTKIKAYFRNYYKEDYVRSLYETSYIGDYFMPSLKQEALGNENVRVDGWEKDRLNVVHVQETEEDSLYLNAIGISKKELGKEREIADYYVDKYKESPRAYDSVIGNTVFIKALSNINVISLLVIAILLANTFAREATCKTDQIMVPTKVGNKNITIAKISTGIIIALGTIVIQVGIIFILSCIFLPMRDWNLEYFAQSGVFLNGVNEWMFTYKEMIQSAIGLMSIAALGTALLTLTLSYISKNRFFVIIPMILFLLSGIALVYVLRSMFQDAVIAPFLPSQMMMFTQFFGSDFSSASLFLPVFEFQGHMIAWKDVSMLSWSAGIILMIIGIVLHSRRHFVNNR